MEAERLQMDREKDESEKENSNIHYRRSKGIKLQLANVKKDVAKGEKENTLPPETVATQGIRVTNFSAEITVTESNNTQITTQQQSKDVVCVQNRVMDLFNKNISTRNVESLILLAEKESMDLDKTIQNTYQYHVKVEPCRNVFGAIKYALENGEWEMRSTSSRQEKTHSPAFQRELERETSVEEPPDPVMLERMACIQENIKALYAGRTVV